MTASHEAAADVLGRPVLVHDEFVGRVSGVFLDATRTRPLGLEVTSPGRPARFLPWVAATLQRGSVVAASAFLLFDSRELSVERGVVLCRERSELGGRNGDVSNAAFLGTGAS